MNCPKCGSNNVRIDVLMDVKSYHRGCLGWLAWLFLAVFTFGLILIIPLFTNSKVRTNEKKVGICQNCGFVVKLYKEQNQWWTWTLAILVFIILFSILKDSFQNEPSNSNFTSISSSNTISGLSEKYSLKVGSNTITIDDKPFTLNAPVLEIGGNTYLPLRFFTDRLGAENLQYNETTEEISFNLLSRSK